MRIFWKRKPPYKLAHFKPEEHPYKPHPSYPLRHGLLKSGEIDWTFWRRQEVWTFDQAVRLLDYTRTGDDGFTATPWDLYQRISDGLEKAFKAGAAHHIFKGEPDTTHGFIYHSSKIYPAPFVEWAYHNGFGIPEGLAELLPELIKQQYGPSAFLENPASASNEAAVAAPVRPDEKAPPEHWASLFRSHKEGAGDRDTKELWEIMALRMEGFTNRQIYDQLFKKGRHSAPKAFISKKIAKCRELLQQTGLPILPQFKTRTRD